MTHSVVFFGNDSRIILHGLTDQDGAIISTATVNLISLLDKAGNAVTGVSVPATMTYTSNGDYEAPLSNTLAVLPERRYFATVRAEYLGLRGEWRETVVCKIREN